MGKKIIVLLFGILLIGSNLYAGDLNVSGKAGIGNNAPTRLLDVVGAGYNNVGTLYTNVSFRQDLTSYRGVALGYDTSGQIGVITPTGGTTNQLAFWTYNGAWGERMRITSGGYIGIGIPTPGYKLDVQGGQINASGGLCISGNCKTDWSQVGGSQWTTSGSDIYYNTGNIGVGTASPTGSLSIAAPDESVRSAIAIRQSNAETYGFDFSLDQTFNGYMFLDRVYGGSKYNVMTFNRDNGNVGIGTTTPGAKLTVRGPAGDANSFYRIENTAGYFRSIYMGSASDIYFNNGINVAYLTDASVWVSGSDMSYKKDIRDMSKYGLRTVMDMKPREYRMKHSSQEQIGFIGQELKTLIPEVVIGEEGKMGIAYGQLTAVLTKAVQEIASGLDITEAGSSSPSIKSAYRGNEAALAIDKDGNLGVGTNNPSSRLDVKGDIKTSGGISAASIASSGSITAHGNIVQSSPDLNNYGISLERTDEDAKYHAWTFWHANTQNNTKNSLEIWEYKANEKSDACTTPDSSCYPRLVIKEGGNVGIGTIAPQSKLEINGGDIGVINGDIRITGGAIIDDGTTLNVPDYVFEKNYKIKDINELSAFVEENKHLPGLPDASSKKEWAKISMQERDMKLLEKIEELTVYILKQQREIETLKAEMKKMKE